MERSCVHEVGPDYGHARVSSHFRKRKQMPGEETGWRRAIAWRLWRWWSRRLELELTFLALHYCAASPAPPQNREQWRVGVSLRIYAPWWVKKKMPRTPPTCYPLQCREESEKCQAAWKQQVTPGTYQNLELMPFSPFSASFSSGASFFFFF